MGFGVCSGCFFISHCFCVVMVPEGVRMKIKWVKWFPVCYKFAFPEQCFFCIGFSGGLKRFCVNLQRILVENKRKYFNSYVVE